MIKHIPRHRDDGGDYYCVNDTHYYSSLEQAIIKDFLLDRYPLKTVTEVSKLAEQGDIHLCKEVLTEYALNGYWTVTPSSLEYNLRLWKLID